MTEEFISGLVARAGFEPGSAELNSSALNHSPCMLPPKRQLILFRPGFFWSSGIGGGGGDSVPTS